MNDTRRLLIVTTVSVTIKAFLLPYADFFRRKGWIVDAIAADATTNEEIHGHFDNLMDVDWKRSPLYRGNFSVAPKQLRAAIDRGNYDIVHVHTPIAAFVTRYALKEMRQNRGLKIVYTAHGFHFYTGGNPLRNFAFRSAERIAGRWTDRLIVINRADHDSALKYAIVPVEALVYMPGIGLDFSTYDGKKASDADVAELRAELRLAPTDSLFLVIGEFNKGKRQRDAIYALAALKDTNVHIAFAGDGPLRGESKVLAKSLGVATRTHFLGQRDDILRLIATSKAVIMPSEREGLSRACMESVCLGKPVIGSNARGVSDVVQPCRGLVYPVGDALALRDAMMQLLEEGHPVVAPDPEWEIGRLIAAHERLYNDLLTSASSQT